MDAGKGRLKQDDVGGDDDGEVGDDVRNPRRYDRASASVEETPETSEGSYEKTKENGECWGGKGEEDDDVMERECETGEDDGGAVWRERAERAKHKPSPVELLKERVKRGEEKTNDDEEGRCGNAECLRSHKRIGEGLSKHVGEQSEEA